MTKGNIVADIFRWATWWLSDDVFVWVKDSFYNSRNIDVRSNWQAISLSKAFVLDHTPPQKVNCIIKTNSGDILAFCNNWWIYRKNWWTRATVTTATPSSPILSACEFNGYIYRAQATALHRVASWSLSNNITWSESITRQALTSSTYHPLIVSMWSMYVWNKSSFDEVNISNVYNSITVIEAGSTIKFLWDLWWVIRVITQSEIGFNNIYLMQKWNNNPDQNIPLLWVWVKNFIIYEWYNYIITEAWLTALDWYKLYKLKDTSTTISFNNNPNAIAVYKDNLIVWWTGCIYTRWKKNKNYPDVLVAEWTTSNNETDDNIEAIFSTWNDLYIAWDNGTTYGIDKLSNETYQTTWELITRWYYADNLHTVKEAVETRFGFQTLITGQQIELLYSIDWWAFNSIVNLAYNDNRKISFTDHIRMIDQFQYIQFKIKLTWPWTSTPSFYSMDFRFNVIDK